MVLMKIKPDKDRNAIQVLKKRFNKFMTLKLNVISYRLIATFLSPFFIRSFQFHDSNLAAESIIVMLLLIEEEAEIDCETESVDDSQEKSSSLLSEFIERPFTPSAADSEIERYKTMPLTQADIDSNPLLQKQGNISEVILNCIVDPISTCNSYGL